MARREATGFSSEMAVSRRSGEVDQVDEGGRWVVAGGGDRWGGVVEIWMENI